VVQVQWLEIKFYFSDRLECKDVIFFSNMKYLVILIKWPEMTVFWDVGTIWGSLQLVIMHGS
jgi:hypothetical protein